MTLFDVPARDSWVDRHGCQWVNVPLDRLVAYADPFTGPRWPDCPPFTAGDVLTAAAAGDISPHYWDPWAPGPFPAGYHVARIAWFIAHPERLEPDSDDVEAPELDVGVVSLGYRPDWIVQAGNHRYAAAVAIGRPRMAFVVSGCLEDAEAMFGVRIR